MGTFTLGQLLKGQARCRCSISRIGKHSLFLSPPHTPTPTTAMDDPHVCCTPTKRTRFWSTHVLSFSERYYREIPRSALFYCTWESHFWNILVTAWPSHVSFVARVPFIFCYALQCIDDPSVFERYIFDWHTLTEICVYKWKSQLQNLNCLSDC